MTKLECVTVDLKANIYFDGQVTSRVLTFADGSTKTLGVMLPGEYEFGTEAEELMEITQGMLDVKLPGSEDWKTFKAGDSFVVPANSKFELRVEEVADYCCSYVQ